MADSKISALPAASVAAGSNEIPINEAGTTKKVTLTQITTDIMGNGWIPVTGTLWEYASATSITVPSGAASLYQKGDKIKLTANGVVLYAYIVGVADTVLTVLGNAITNYTFSNVYVSRAENPFGFPDYFIYTPTWAGFSAAPSNKSTYTIKGNMVFVNISIYGLGTSNAATLTVTMPIACRSTVQYERWRTHGEGCNANAWVSGGSPANLDAGSATLTCYNGAIEAANSWTNSSGKAWEGQIFYAI